MYFPEKFDRETSLELLELVIKAYDQYDAYKKNRPWIQPGGYTLLNELRYTGSKTGALFRENALFERELKELLSSYGKIIKGLPIGFILQRKNNLYIILRGTMTTSEWLHNLNMSLKPYRTTGFGKVHEGFLQIYNVVRNEIGQTLAEMEHIKRIFIAGHSLGGALATLLVPDIPPRQSKSVTVYTYGSPRVGDNTFVEAYNRKFGTKTFRIANTSDIVTSVPFPVPFMGFLGGHFSHVDTPVDFTVQKNDIEKNHHVETYLAALTESRKSWSFFRRFFG